MVDNRWHELGHELEIVHEWPGNYRPNLEHRWSQKAQPSYRRPAKISHNTTGPDEGAVALAVNTNLMNSGGRRVPTRVPPSVGVSGRLVESEPVAPHQPGASQQKLSLLTGTQDLSGVGVSDWIQCSKQSSSPPSAAGTDRARQPYAALRRSNAPLGQL